MLFCLPFCKGFGHIRMKSVEVIVHVVLYVSHCRYLAAGRHPVVTLRKEAEVWHLDKKCRVVTKLAFDVQVL